MFVSAGTVPLLHEKIGLKSGRLAYIMLVSSLFLTVLLWLQYVGNFLSLWNGGRAAESDGDGTKSDSFSLEILGTSTSLFLLVVPSRDTSGKFYQLQLPADV